ncbi:MAG: Rieske 2Fe-2S domain-containing protein [Chloroflexi bacterium]|nr:Rieske 2Fe-2S domain-containing protein [Chloroflexota bacterium]
MIAPEVAQRLASVGPGTPMGNLLRRYWYPIAAGPELNQDPVRLLGEDLILFRSGKGELGLIGPRCAHRGLSLAYGIPQENGLRCAFHGWTYDTAGQVVGMPFEPACLPLYITAYRVQELGGLIFAYLGPEPAPLLPRWDSLVRTDATKRVEFTTLPCSWLQCVENIMDPVHVEHLHGHYNNYFRQRRGIETKVLPKRHVKMEFDVKRYGIYKRRLLEGQSEDTYEWQVGHPLLFPNILGLPTEDRMLLDYRVPIDDSHTNDVSYFAIRPENWEPLDPLVRVDYDPLTYDESGRVEGRDVGRQDEMAFVAQGPITDRSRWHPATSDKGVVLLHRLLLENIERVERREDPLGVIRDPEENEPMIQIDPGPKPGGWMATFMGGQFKRDVWELTGWTGADQPSGASSPQPAMS